MVKKLNYCRLMSYFAPVRTVWKKKLLLISEPPHLARCHSLLSVLSHAAVRWLQLPRLQDSSKHFHFTCISSFFPTVTSALRVELRHGVSPLLFHKGFALAIIHHGCSPEVVKHRCLFFRVKSKCAGTFLSASEKTSGQHVLNVFIYRSPQPNLSGVKAAFQNF